MESKLQHLYEYAVVRFVPSIERGEFINIGLVMMCKRQKWIEARFEINVPRILAVSPDADIDTLKSQIMGFRNVVSGNIEKGGVIAELESHERFRWLTAVRSACLQTSRPHAGLTENLEQTFSVLFDTLVL